MGLTSRDTGDGEGFEPCPTGVHHAICFAIYDLGIQHSEFYADKAQVLIMWELPHERMEDSRPFAVNRRYTNSLNEKANLRKDLETWRGRELTEEEIAGFDLRKLLGANCQVQIIHATKNKKTYANVSAVVPLSKGMAQLKPENAQVSFEMGESVPEQAPDWIKDLIGKAIPEEVHEHPREEYIPPEETTEEPF